MTKKLTKRIISFVVTLAMVMVLLPTIPAMADEAAESVTAATEVESKPIAQADGIMLMEAGAGSSSSNPCKSADDVATALGGTGKAKVTENNTVKLIADIEDIGDLYINAPEDLTLDLADHSITLKSDCTLILMSNVTITGTDGFITQADGTTYPTVQVGASQKEVTVKLTGGTIKKAENTPECVLVNGNDSFEMSGGKLESNKFCLYLQGESSAKISGSADINSTSTAIEIQAVTVMQGSSLEMSGGKITSTGVCMQVDGKEGSSQATVTSGTIESTAADKTTPAVYVITNGSFGMTGGNIKTTGGLAVSVGKDGDDTNATATIGGEADISRTGGANKGLLEVKGKQCKLNIEDNAQIHDEIMVFKNGELNISGGTITSEGYAVGTNGSKEDSENTSVGAKINITGGTITGGNGSCAIYAPAGTWTITNGEITGGAGIVVRGADVDVQGGTITATAASATSIDVGDAGHPVPAAGITVDIAGYPEQEPGQPHVTISDGATVKATAEDGKTLAACNNGEAVVPGDGGKVEAAKNPFSVSGGTFTTGAGTDKESDAVNQFLAENYTYTDEGITYNGDDAEVTLNNVKCATLEEALEKAVNGDTITLLKDVDISDTITIASGALTIDLADHNITSTKARVFVVKTGGSLTIEGTTGVVSNESASDPDFMVIADGDNTKLTINGGTIEQKKDQVAVSVQNGATMTLTDGTIKGSDTADTNKAAVNVCCDSGKSGGVLTMNSGTISGGCYAVNSFGEGSKVSISGGKLENTESGSGLSVSDKASAEITGTAEVSGNFGATVSGGAKLTVSGDAEITGTGTNAESGIEVKGEGTTAEIKENAKVSGDYGIYAKDQAKLTVSGGTVEGTAAGIGTNGDDKATPADITVSGGKVSGDTAGVYLPSGKMTVENGANITGPAGIVQFGGELTVNGGTITANGTADVEIGASGKKVPPAAVVTNKQAGYDDNVKADLKGGSFTAAEGKPAVTYTENGEEAAPAAEAFKVEGGTYTTGTEADVSVYQYVGSEHAVDPTNGTVGAEAEVALTIIDFGYVEDIDAEGVVDADGIFTSVKDIKYNAKTAQWTDATFYWCFNRALKDGENVEITLTANGKTYTDTCEGNGVSPRYAASLLSDSQFGDEVSTNGVQIGDYTISGKIGGESETVIAAATGVNPVNVDKVPEQLSGNYAPVVVAATIADRTAEGTIGNAATDATATYVGTTPGEGGKTIYNIIGTAKNLKKHLNGAASPTEGYWFGIEIQAPTGVDTEGADKTYKITIDGEEAGSSTFDALPHIEEGAAKGAIIYFNVKGDDTDKYIVDIEWAQDTTYTYSIDLTGVELYGAASFVDGETDSYGFIAKGDNDLLNSLAPLVKGENEEWGTPITDCKDNTFYAAFKVDPANADGKSYTVKFANEAGNSYSTTIDAATKGGIAYFTPAWQDGKTDNNIPTENYQGKYTVTVTKTGDTNPDDTAEIKVYKIIYKAVNGKFGEAAEQDSGLYAASVTDADAIIGTMPEVTPDDGFKAAEWGAGVASDDDYTITYTATCSEIEKYTVTCETATGGKVEADKTDVAAGDTVTLTVTADSGYSFESLTVKDADGTEVETAQQADGTYTFTMPSSNVTVTATFTADVVPMTYTVTIETATGGKVEADKTADLAEGETVTLTVTADSGYNFGSLTVKDADSTEVETTLQADGTYTFTMPASNVTVTATFTADVVPTTYTVTIETATGGKVEADKTADLAEGDTVTLTVTADSGYNFGSLTVKDAEGTEVETAQQADGTYTFTMPASNVTVTATFTADVVPTTYTVTIETATGGKVEADKTDVAEGETVTLTVTPNSNYNFGSLTVKDADGAKVETTRQADGTYTFTMPASDVTVTATFSRKSTGGGRGGSGGGSASGGETSYSVSVPSKSNNGSVSANLKNATKGSKVTFTVTPNMGYMASGVTVKDANGNEIAVTDNGDGTYTFVMPDSKVSIAAEFVKKETGTPDTTPTPDAEENCPSAKFTDVDQSQWYHEGIDYALTNGLMNGMSDTTFEPNSTTTRAMVVAVLYRLDGSPATAQAGFADVPADAWYADAVAWGEANGVVSGYSAETFGPSDSITREQMAAILYRYAQYKGVDVSAQADLSKYSDADAVSDWANTALSWANAEGLISGMSDAELAPTDTATRAQVASILMRFCENIVK